jgi:hypothetical protein
MGGGGVAEKHFVLSIFQYSDERSANGQMGEEVGMGFIIVRIRSMETYTSFV